MILGGWGVKIPIVIVKVLLPWPRVWPLLFALVCVPPPDSLDENTLNRLLTHQVEYIQERRLRYALLLCHMFLRWAVVCLLIRTVSIYTDVANSSRCLLALAINVFEFSQQRIESRNHNLRHILRISLYLLKLGLLSNLLLHLRLVCKGEVLSKG